MDNSEYVSQTVKNNALILLYCAIITTMTDATMILLSSTKGSILHWKTHWIFWGNANDNKIRKEGGEGLFHLPVGSWEDMGYSIHRGILIRQ